MKTIAGLVTGEIKEKTTKNGKDLTEFSVLIAKDTFVRVTAWDTLGEIAAGFQRGDIVQVTGDYSEEEYEGKSYRNITAKYLAVQQYPEGYLKVPKGFDVIDDDELPFA